MLFLHLHSIIQFVFLTLNPIQCTAGAGARAGGSQSSAWETQVGAVGQQRLGGLDERVGSKLDISLYQLTVIKGFSIIRRDHILILMAVVKYRQ